MGWVCMAINWEFVKRRWYDFRQGHGTYLSYFPSVANQLLVIFTFFVVTYLGFENNFWNLTGFVSLIVAIYVPSAIVIGYYHNKNQLPTDSKIAADKNPVTQDILRSLARLEAEQEEIKQLIRRSL
jgi:hypothetical protein